MDRAHDVDSVCTHRIPVPLPHNGLGRQMKDQFRLRLNEGFLQMFQISNVPYDRVQFIRQSGQLIQARLRGRLQGVPRDLRPRLQKNPAEPSTLEAGVASHKDPFSTIKR